MAGIGVGLNILGAIVGELWASGDREQAKKLMEQAAAQYNIPLPQLQEMVAPHLDKSAFDDIQGDPALRDAQMGALGKLKGIEDAGGLMIEDRAVLNKLQSQTARQAAARQSGIREDMAERGIGGSGAELAMQQGNAQDEASRASQAGLDIAAQAQKRYFDSILQRGRMAGDIRGQDYGEARDRAAARDEINRYNADSMWRGQQANNQVRQQNYDNRWSQADQRAKNLYGQADYYRGEAARKSGQASGFGKAAGKAVNAFGDDEDEYR